VRQVLDHPEQVHLLGSARSQPIAYVVAFGGGGAKDVTRRYTQWSAALKSRLQDSWWEDTLRPLVELESRVCTSHHDQVKGERSGSHAQTESGILPKNLTEVAQEGVARNRAVEEDMELQIKELTEKLPKSQGSYRNHPLYVLEKHLKKHQMLRPHGPVLGMVAGAAVFPRSSVQELHTSSQWKRLGRRVKQEEEQMPAKKIQKNPKLSQQNDKATNSPPVVYPELASTGSTSTCMEIDPSDSGSDTKLYGEWQTEKMYAQMPVNGRVPRNEYNNVEVFSEVMLPPGTVHLRYSRIGDIAARLQIDAAPAVVGFESRAGRRYPQIDGVVVLEEHSEVLLSAYLADEAQKETIRKRKRVADANSRWRQFLRAVWMRRGLREKYSIHCSSRTSKTKQHPNGDMSIDANPIFAPEAIPSPLSHTHTYPPSLREKNEQTGVTVMKCSCGFVVEVEEI